MKIRQNIKAEDKLMFERKQRPLTNGRSKALSRLKVAAKWPHIQPRYTWAEITQMGMWVNSVGCINRPSLPSLLRGMEAVAGIWLANTSDCPLLDHRRGELAGSGNRTDWQVKYFSYFKTDTFFVPLPLFPTPLSWGREEWESVQLNFTSQLLCMWNVNCPSLNLFS